MVISFRERRNTPREYFKRDRSMRGDLARLGSIFFTVINLRLIMAKNRGQ